MTTAIRPARPDEIDDLGRLIAVSFDHLDANAYLVPAPADRIPVMADFFALLTGHAAGYGRVDVLDGPRGPVATAVWFDLTRDVPDPPDYDRRMTALSGVYRGHFDALDDLFGKHHPHDPHWHLAFLAVHPDHQGAGLGSALMSRTHEELDAAGTPAYLEATNADNVRLYRRHGYADMDPFDISLPDGTPFYRMWRPAA
ncbi:GNAT family N-acetyltransferase [Jidongwangia harbinensis]|uniref:GNAT family N-acetyltransferase n=1 Tax=Jidongwangia harbinensis TaxID=2878561 RepID=UPI001CD96D51|nr:GNAT family N-acetyltransferase [Jidongwangia harbinensis]MCA2214031.1 GNAT family N-acetyltransferase [Jidongwangia harbinensis]